jgi:hypothetical protein
MRRLAIRWNLPAVHGSTNKNLASEQRLSKLTFDFVIVSEHRLDPHRSATYRIEQESSLNHCITRGLFAIALNHATALEKAVALPWRLATEPDGIRGISTSIEIETAACGAGENALSDLQGRESAERKILRRVRKCPPNALREMRF